MNMIVGFHLLINNNFWQYLEVTAQRYLAIILEISVRFTLNELRHEFSSSFDIIADFEEGGILILQIAVMFGIKKKKNESKRKHQVPEFLHKQEDKIPFNNLTRNKTSR